MTVALDEWTTGARCVLPEAHAAQGRAAWYHRMGEEHRQAARIVSWIPQQSQRIKLVNGGIDVQNVTLWWEARAVDTTSWTLFATS